MVAPASLPLESAPSTSQPADGERRHPLPVIVIDGSVGWRRWGADLVLYRGALQSLFWRNLRSRYKQAALGMLWAVIQPAVQVGVFTVLFGMLAKIPSGGIPYPVFALAGLLPWNLFNKIVSEGAQSLVTNQNIITKLFFPRIYLVIAVGASALVDAAVTVVLLGGLLAYYHTAPVYMALLAIPVLIGVLILAYGVAALLSSLNARWRDVQHTLPFVLQVGMLVTPVIYPTTFVPERWRWLLAFNPLTGWIELMRSSVTGVPLPARDVLLGSVLMSIGMIIVGVLFFRRSEGKIVDVV